MTVDVEIRPYGEDEIWRSLHQVDWAAPNIAASEGDRLKVETHTFDRSVETSDAEEFFEEVSGAQVDVRPETGLSRKADVGELQLDADEEAYEHVDTIVGLLEDHGYEVPEIRFSDGMNIERLGAVHGGKEVEDVQDYLENFENGKHQIVITAEKGGERTAVKYSTDGYAVIEKGRQVYPEEEEFWKPDRELGFELSEELRDTDIPIEWRTGARQNIDYTEEEVEYEDGTVSPEGEPAPLPTSVTGGNEYDTTQRSYEVDGEEFTGTALEPRARDKGYLQRLKEML